MPSTPGLGHNLVQPKPLALGLVAPMFRVVGRATGNTVAPIRRYPGVRGSPRCKGKRSSGLESRRVFAVRWAILLRTQRRVDMGPPI